MRHSTEKNTDVKKTIEINQESCYTHAKKRQIKRGCEWFLASVTITQLHASMMQLILCPAKKMPCVPGTCLYLLSFSNNLNYTESQIQIKYLFPSQKRKFIHRHSNNFFRLKWEEKERDNRNHEVPKRKIRVKTNMCLGHMAHKKGCLMSQAQSLVSYA